MLYETISRPHGEDPTKTRNPCAFVLASDLVRTVPQPSLQQIQGIGCVLMKLGSRHWIYEIALSLNLSHYSVRYSICSRPEFSAEGGGP